MTDDIVTRLRQGYGQGCKCYAHCYCECGCGAEWAELYINEAADEIERLRKELDEWKCISEDLYEWTANVLGRYMTTPAVKAYERRLRGA